MDNILSREERLIHSFRALCSRYGYRPYRMSKFEEYDLYANNRSFLPEGGVITFTDTNGRLMALKPDVTLSIARNLTPAPGESVRVFYDESVYRAPDRQLGFQEITQTGLEYLGEADAYAMGEVVSLAAQSLELIEPGYILDVSHMGFMAGLIDALKAGDVAGVARRMYNVFEDVLEPRAAKAVNEIKLSLLDNGALGAAMTGSGSAVFGLCPDEETARRAHAAAKERCREAFLAVSE